MTLVGKRPTKIEQLRACAASGDWVSALRIAARFHRLGVERDAITQAWAASQHPQFYQELGVDPSAAVARGVAALKRRYAL